MTKSFVGLLDGYVNFSDSDREEAVKWEKQLGGDARTVAHLASGHGGGSGFGTINIGNVEIDYTSGIKLVNPITGYTTFTVDPEGDLKLGSNVSTPADTTMLALSNARIYNSEQMGVGDLLLGDNSSGKANLFWDRSTGTLSLRAGTTASVVLDSTGITATWGKIGGWTIATSTLTATGIVLDAGNDKITVGTDKIVIDGGNQKITVGADPVNRINIDGADNRIYFTKAGTQYIRMEGDDANIIVGAGTTDRIEIDGFNGWIKSTNYASGASGFQIKAASGDAEFNNIVARGTFRTSVFQKDNVIATGGQVFISKSAAEVYADVTSPAGIGAMDIDIKHDDDGVSLLANGDVCRIKGWNGTEVIDVWFTISSQVDHTTYSTYTTLCNSGFSYNIQKGMAVVDYGQNGDGLISLEAGDPTRMRVMTHTGTPYVSLTNRVVLGNLNGNYGATGDDYGIGIGDYSSGNFLSYNADGAASFEIQAGDGAVQIGSGGIDLYGDGVGSGSNSNIDFYKSGVHNVAIYITDNGSTYRTFSITNSAKTQQTDFIIRNNVSATYPAQTFIQSYSGTERSEIQVIADSDNYNKIEHYSDYHEYYGSAGITDTTKMEIYGGLELTASGAATGIGIGASVPGYNNLVLNYNNTSGTEYGFISSGGDGMYLGANAYYPGSWKVQDAGYATYLAVLNNGTTALRLYASLTNHASGGIALSGASLRFEVTATGRVLSNAGGVFGYSEGSPYSDDGITFYIGTTRYASIHVDTTWLRLDNESKQTGVYTPQYFYAADGLRAGSLAAAPTANQGRVAFVHDGGLTSAANSTSYYTLGYHTLSTYLTSGSWEARTGTLSPTKQDLSALFGAPAGIYGVVLRLILKTSATHPNTATYFQCGPGSAASGYGHGAVYAHGDSMYCDNCVTVGCDSGGDIWANIGGTATVTTYMRILGYFI